MKLKQLLSILASFIITAIVFSAVAFVVGYSDFFTYTLAEKQKQVAIFFCTLLSIVVGSIYIIIIFFKRNRKFTAIGMYLPVLFGLFLLFLLGKSYVEITLSRPFEKTTWIAAKQKPFKMALSLTKSNALIGISRQAVIEMLGDSDDAHGEPGTPNYISYFTDNNNWVLVFHLENGKVIESYLYEDNLCI